MQQATGIKTELARGACCLELVALSLEGAQVEEQGGDGLGVLDLAGVEAGEGLVESQG